MIVEAAVIGGGLFAAYVVFGGKMTFDRLVLLDERCNTAFADIDVLLKHRHDLLPGLMQVVSGVLVHERDMLDRTMMMQREAMRLGAEHAAAQGRNGVAAAEARATAAPATVSVEACLDARLEAENAFGELLRGVVERASYEPSLQTNAHFISFRDALTETEHRIVAARRYYNAAVEEFNASARSSSAALLRPLTRLSPRQAYSAGASRVLLDEAVQVQFA